MGILLGGIDFAGLQFMVGDSAITYGVFIQSVVEFIIIAFVIFIAVKAIAKAQKLGEGEPEPVAEEKPAEPSAEVKLLTEIRDSLRR
jgi:large conductance mechanosensitive channel